MKLLSWNVNGLRSAVKKGLLDVIKEKEYDVLMFQEIKTEELPAPMGTLGYHSFLYPAVKKGYSGLLTMSREKPVSSSFGIGSKDFDDEARALITEFDKFFVVNVYYPNSRRDLSRLDYKMSFNKSALEFFQKLQRTKPVIVCGDFNVAHTEDDIARAKENDGNAGFTMEERNFMSRLLSHGFVDTFRIFYKGGGKYSWWLYGYGVRERNIGWRLDYCLVSKELEDRVKSSIIRDQVLGSDHAPVVLEIDEE